AQGANRGVPAPCADRYGPSSEYERAVELEAVGLPVERTVPIALADVALQLQPAVADSDPEVPENPVVDRDRAVDDRRVDVADLRLEAADAADQLPLRRKRPFARNADHGQRRRHVGAVPGGARHPTASEVQRAAELCADVRDVKPD